MYFNIYNYKTDGTTPFIIPMLGVGYSYIKFFPMLFTCLAEWLVVKLDYHANNNSYIEQKYILYYFGFYCVLCLGFNTQIIWGGFITTFLPIYLLLKVNNAVNKSNANNEVSYDF